MRRCCLFVFVTSVASASLSLTTTGKKLPSCRQKQSARRLSHKVIKLRVGRTYRLVLHLLWVISDHLSTSGVPTHRCQSGRCEVALMIGSQAAGREEGVPAAWRQTLLSSTVTHASRSKPLRPTMPPNFMLLKPFLGSDAFSMKISHKEAKNVFFLVENKIIKKKLVK